MLPSGSRIAGRFEVERLAGRGGMGSVYRAHDPLRGGPVAIKLLHEDQQRAVEIERFSREAELLSQLRHPGIVDYVAHGRTPDGQYYLAMEWLEGIDLAALFVSGRRPALEESVSILVQAADAVASAHHRGVVHRDLKPSNLFLVDGRADRVKVLDFGIARTVKPSALTRTGHVLGTPDYMAPEQARGARQLTPAADVFALGCVFYELLVGRPPFAADQLAAVLTRILFEDPEPLTQRVPGLDPRLSGLVDKMLAKDVTQRIPDAVALGVELSRLGAAPETISTGATPPGGRGGGSLIDVKRGLHGVVLIRGARGSAPADFASLIGGAGARWEWLLDDTLVASVRGYDSAFDLAEQAARVALLIQQHWSGAEVVLAVGVDASEKAANLLRARASQPGGIWLDELAAKLLARRYELGSENGAPLLKPGAARVDEDRPLLGRPTACVGREQELGAIEAALAGCIDDSEPRAVLVLSGPGLGKSRLRHELLRRVSGRQREPLVLSGTGELASAGAPYGILRQAVRRLAGVEPGLRVEVAQARLSALAGAVPHTACFVGELAGIPFPENHHPALASARANPQIMQEQIHQAFSALVAGLHRPILLVLDDLQWSDALSVALIDHVLQHCGAPLLVLALARPEIHEAFPRLWHGRRVQELTLAALSKRASERLLVQVLGDRLPPEKLARLVELSGGNALFLEELARTAAENPDAPVPDTVMAMIEARVGRLPEDPRRLLFVASVLGRSFAAGELSALAYALLGASDDVDGNLERLVEAELIARIGADDYTFRHALVQTASYELLGADERRQIHERAAEVLARGPDPDALVIAEHWQKSLQPARAIPWLLQAAQTAFARCDIPSAMRGVQRALALGPTGTVRGTLRAVEGLCLGYTGQLPIAALDEALELLPNNDTFWCMACHLRLTLALMTGGWESVAPLAQRFLTADPTDDAIPEYVSGAGTLSTVFVHAGLAMPARQLHARVEAVAARRPDLPLVETWLVWNRACILDIDGAPAPDVLREVERSSELYQAIANQRNGFFCEGLASLLIAASGDAPRAIARLRRAILSAEQLNEHYVRAWMACQLAQILAGGPGHLEALAITDSLIALGVAPPCPDLALGIRARALLTAGRVVEAEASARAALERLAWSPVFAATPAAALVECLTRAGRHEEAVAAGERWMANPPPNTSARKSFEELASALAAARGQR
jgi:hypothetical protein